MSVWGRRMFLWVCVSVFFSFFFWRIGTLRRSSRSYSFVQLDTTRAQFDRGRIFAYFLVCVCMSQSFFSLYPSRGFQEILLFFCSFFFLRSSALNLLHLIQYRVRRMTVRKRFFFLSKNKIKINKKYICAVCVCVLSGGKTRASDEQIQQQQLKVYFPLFKSKFPYVRNLSFFVTTIFFFFFLTLAWVLPFRVSAPRSRSDSRQAGRPSVGIILQTRTLRRNFLRIAVR